ncbi:uncharacterized protein FPRN_10801 [Fusarium proliferatum]|nr:uncharacterized protein FPRN_10801 [Fusarium proliferatum]
MNPSTSTDTAVTAGTASTELMGQATIGPAIQSSTETATGPTAESSDQPTTGMTTAELSPVSQQP